MKIKVGDLIKTLSAIRNKHSYVYIACDEEWNTIFTEFKIQHSEEDKAYVLFGLSGSELNED